MRYLIVLLGMGAGFLNFQAFATNREVYTPFLHDQPPEIVEIVAEFIDAKTGIGVQKLKFLSRICDENEVIIYGILATPARIAPGLGVDGGEKEQVCDVSWGQAGGFSGKTAMPGGSFSGGEGLEQALDSPGGAEAGQAGGESGKSGGYPGVLVVHGGGGCADQMFDQVMGWAKLGYVSFCQDEPGICGPGHRSSGPEASFVRCAGDAASMAAFSVYDGVVAALNGLRMLRSQPEVDKARIGVTGGSWGGYMVTMVSGLAGERVKASFSHYGCGYYDVGSHWSAGLEQMDAETRSRWLETLDAGRRAGGITSHFMLTSPTNDWYFWPGAMMATYNAIGSDKNFCIAANANHVLDIPGGTSSTRKGPHRSYMEVQWMNYHLKGMGEPFGTCSAEATATRQDQDIQVGFRYQGVHPAEDAEIWYSYGETPYRSNYWKRAAVTAEGPGRYAGLIPVYETELPIVWYGSAYDRLDEDGREYSCSTTYQMVEPVSAGFGPEERRDEPLVEGFEQDLTRWKKPIEESSQGQGRYEFCVEAAYRGGKGLRLMGEQMIRCDGMRGLAFKRFARGLSMWVKNPGGTDFDVQLMAEEANNVRHYWVARQSDPGPEWVEVWVPWAQFVYQGRGEAAVEMLSARLGQLGFVTPAEADIYIDDIATAAKAWEGAAGSAGMEAGREGKIVDRR